VVLALLIPLVLAAAPAHAGDPAKTQKKQPAWVVLVHSDTGVPSSWSDSLRTAVESGDPSLKWVPPPAVSLDDAELAVGCASWGPVCASQIAVSMGAQNAFVITVSGGKSPALDVTAVKEGGSLVRSNVHESLPDLGAGGLRLSRAIVVAVLKEQKVTALVVTSDPAGATVQVDGGPANSAPVVVTDITPGAHTLVLTAPGHDQLSRTVQVGMGSLVRENAVLTSSVHESVLHAPAAQPPLAQAPHDLSAGRVGGFVGVGTGALAILGGGVIGALGGVQIQSDLVALRTRQDALDPDHNGFAAPPPPGGDVAGFEDKKAAYTRAYNAAALDSTLIVVGVAMAGTGLVVAGIGGVVAALSE
jgi:hypothetical protein